VRKIFRSQPFSDLLRAFRQDQKVHRYPDWDSVLDYCVYSANPVGRLVLYLCDYRDEERQRLSDYTCTALQLANFWQDVSRDLEKGRIYIPLDALAEHGLTEADIVARRSMRGMSRLMKSLIARTRAFCRGAPLRARTVGHSCESISSCSAAAVSRFSTRSKPRDTTRSRTGPR
jgi:phytoene/squalene synthetase